MAFPLLLIYIALIFLRPQEWVPFMHGMRAVNLVAIPTIGAALFAGTQEDTKLVRAPQSWLMLALFGAMLMSHLAHTYFAAFMETITGDFSRVVILFFLITILVTNLARVKAALLVIIVSALVMSWHAILQGHRGYGFAGFEPLYQHGTILRVRWIGIFNDPNDLALILVTILPFLFSKIVARRASPPSRLLSAAACFPIVYAIVLTESRGGWLALGAMAAMFAVMHLKKKKLALIVGGLAFWMLIGIGPERVGLGDRASSRARISHWGTANRLLKQWPVFGAGLGRFREFSVGSQVAHNSFVHCWAELGMVGYFVWLSLGFATVKDCYALTQMQPETPPEEDGPEAEAAEEACELARLGRATIPALTGYLAASFFLTRTYTLPLYILYALAVCMRLIYEERRGPLPGRFDWKDLKPFGIIAVVSVPAMWLTIRALN